MKFMVQDEHGKVTEINNNQELYNAIIDAMAKFPNADSKEVLSTLMNLVAAALAFNTKAEDVVVGMYRGYCATAAELLKKPDTEKLQ